MRSLIFIILILNITTYTNANCLNLLMLESVKRLNIQDHYLFSSEFERLKDLKRKNFFNEIKDYNTKPHRVLKSPHKFKKALEILIVELFNNSTYERWAYEFYNDLIVEIYLSKDSVAIMNFERFGIISKEIVISLLLERSTQGGFSGNRHSIKLLTKGESDKKFFTHVKKGYLLFDKAFSTDKHGDLIHMFQLDIIIQTLKQHDIDPIITKELYKWFGKEKLIIKVDENFNESPWEAFFDGSYGTITEPDTLNPALMEFFGINKFEVLDHQEFMQLEKSEQGFKSILKSLKDKIPFFNQY